MDIKEIPKYLPRYLSEESYEKILKELQGFPENIDKRFYSLNLDDEDPIQGDGVLELPCIKLPNADVKKVPCIILSNSCDISKANKRDFPVGVLYAPILKLNKLEEKLRKTPGKSPSQVSGILQNIRKQKYSSILYLPGGYSFTEESFVFLDTICNCTLDYLLNYTPKPFLFRLSNYGFYVLLMKMAIHFTRMQEGIDRIT